ncbi:ABC transporter ATP-binding protein [Enterococcus sp. LJL99]
MINNQPIIQVTDLVKKYDKLTALDHFNLTVEKGEVLGLLGPNGSGKSTSINCILSLLTYDAGEIKLFGEKMAPDKQNLKRKIGVVPQDVAVFEELTVYENIDYFCGLYVSDKAKRAACVAEALRIVQLDEFKTFYPSKLSGGLKRRLNIACGIAHEPELIFFDEPTVAVDPQSRNKILESIQELNSKGATIVYTSHYMEEIEQICTKIVIMDKGFTLAIGTKEELKRMIQTSEKLQLDLPTCTDELIQEIKSWPGVLQVHYDGTTLKLDTLKEEKILLKLLHHLETTNLLFGDFYSLQPTLNDVFLEITGKQLRD